MLSVAVQRLAFAARFTNLCCQHLWLLERPLGLVLLLQLLWGCCFNGLHAQGRQCLATDHQLVELVDIHVVESIGMQHVMQLCRPAQKGQSCAKTCGVLVHSLIQVGS